MPSITLTPTAPFDLHLTASHQTYYQRESGADRYQDGVYSRVLLLGGSPVLAIVRFQGSADQPHLSLELAGDGASRNGAEGAVQQISHILTLDLPLRPFYAAVRDDPFLGEATRQMYGLHPPQTASVYEALVMAVIGQQISGVVARSIRARVVQALGAPLSISGHPLSAFPTPEAFLEAGPERLRVLGLSARKAEYIMGIAARAAEGALEHGPLSRMSNQEVIEDLTRLRGVGLWTAQWVLLRALARPDAFPAGDLALRRLISEVYFDGREVMEAEASAFGRERWGGFSGLATTYMFAYIRRRRVLQEQRE
ncbi:MAG: DNA-3-methyladenine glycosylase 2 [Chloroflexi bacterium]|nr:DNA-3-methyladenine glycosylase 2 [Chloroflexota bacterium]